uniref:Uncharacterized protein n=1 Tax=Rhizophora mucronata TaxID=61149 RepID=A0A2P2QEW7_RHIMU
MHLLMYMLVLCARVLVISAKFVSGIFI